MYDFSIRILLISSLLTFVLFEISHGIAKENPLGGAVPTVGQVKKIKASGTTKKGSNTEEKDENGCFRVPGYVGVYVDPKGRHFVKIEGQPLREKVEDGNDAKNIFYFCTIEDAARAHDEEIKKRSGTNQTNGLKLNFKANGSRIIHDATATSTAGRNLEMLGMLWCKRFLGYFFYYYYNFLNTKCYFTLTGAGASSVVPALSVINIKVRVSFLLKSL